MSTTLTRWVRATAAKLAAGIAACALAALMVPTSAQAVTIANAVQPGYALYLPQAGHYTWLGAYRDPSSKAPNALSWCTEVDAVAPTAAELTNIYSLEGNKQIQNLGGEDVSIHSAAQMAWILDHYEKVATADSRAAIAVIVHLNYDSTNADSWGAYWGAVQAKYPAVAQLVRQYIAQAKASGVHSYEGVVKPADGQRTGVLKNIGVKSGQGTWIEGVPVSVTLSGPAVFTTTGTNKWTGKTLNGPLELEWKATGPGEVRFLTRFSFKHNIFHLQSKPGFQNMLINSGDPVFHEGPGGSFKVSYPTVKTTALGVADKVVPSLPDQVVTDKVCYTDLVPGKEYTVDGKLMDKATGKELIAQATGKPYKGSTTFTPEAAAGCVNVEFKVDGRDLAGKTTVVFEDLLEDGKTVATHADINDHEQTIPPPPEVKTTAMGTKDGDKVVAGLPNQKVYDKVCYTSLIPGKEYTLEGTLMNAETGKPLKGKNGYYTSKKTFAPATAQGCELIEFDVDGRDLIKAPTVVFEDLYMGKIKVASHADIKDRDQTVPPAPSVKTTARDGADGDQEIKPEGNQQIRDQVCYTNLTPGKEYTLDGTLMDKSTGKPLTGSDGKAVTSTIKHTPTKANGCAEVVFTVDASSLAGRHLVVFESLKHDGRELAVHADINDEGQTVHVSIPPKELAKTGTSAGLVVLCAVGLLSAGALTVNTRKVRA